MMNFNIIRNFEMKRSRFEKNQYDSMTFAEYVAEVFSAIKSKTFLFLKAFSKPIQKDYVEALAKIKKLGIMEEMNSNLDNSEINEIDDLASILTIDLYLSLEKTREKENEKLRQIELDRLGEIKMPLGLIKLHKSEVDVESVRNKISVFAE